MRMIDGDALKARMLEYYADSWNLHEEIMDFFDNSPTIEKRKKGKWNPEFNGAFTGGAYWFSCSECGRIVPDVRNGGWEFCPKCGSNNGRT